MSTYSIKDLEHLSSIKAHTIRIWEQRYNLLKPERTDTNIRYYSDRDLKHLLNIALLKNNGYKISKIAEMPLEQISQEVVELSDNFGSNEYISELTLAMLDLDTVKFERIMALNIDRIGLERTIIDIIYPFLHKIGVLWMTGSIVPAQEHFITNLIRQKIIGAIDREFSAGESNGDKFVLFLPEGELHEISLLFADYIIRNRGARSIYLGQSVPLEDLATVCQSHSPKYVLTVLTSSGSIESMGSFVEQMCTYLPDTNILLTGFQAVNSNYQFPERVRVLRNHEELVSLI